MPSSDKTLSCVSGQFDSIAVRVTDHPLVQDLCHRFGKPITSTSANLTGLPPCLTTEEVRVQLGNKLFAILDGKTGGRIKPSEIRDAKTSAILRQG
jgi:L-threonylcarbamoyladenylate synthase